MRRGPTETVISFDMIVNCGGIALFERLSEHGTFEEHSALSKAIIEACF